MDSDEEMRVDDSEPINWPTAAKGKGKGKATQHNESYDVENLPWYVRSIPTRLHAQRMTKEQGGEVPSGNSGRRCVTSRHH